MRILDGTASMAIDARVSTAAEAPALMGDVSSWGGTQTSCVGGHMVFCPFQVAAGATVVIDESMDWRDRHLFIFGTAYKDLDIRPGTVDAFQIAPVVLTGGTNMLKLASDFYTNAGWDKVAGARGGVNKVNWCEWVRTDNTMFSDLRIFADTTNNNRLSVQNLTAFVYYGMMTIFATEQTGRVVAVL